MNIIEADYAQAMSYFGEIFIQKHGLSTVSVVLASNLNQTLRGTYNLMPQYFFFKNSIPLLSNYSSRASPSSQNLLNKNF